MYRFKIGSYFVLNVILALPKMSDLVHDTAHNVNFTYFFPIISKMKKKRKQHVVTSTWLRDI